MTAGNVSRLQPQIDITIRKDDRERRYLIRAESTGRWIGEVWFGRNLHDQRRVAGALLANRLRNRFTREIRDLLKDGWTES